MQKSTGVDFFIYLLVTAYLSLYYRYLYFFIHQKTTIFILKFLKNITFDLLYFTVILF